MARVIQTLKGAPPPRTLQGYLQTDLARERARRGLPVVDLEHFTGQHGGPAPPDVVRQINAFTQQVQRETSRKPSGRGQGMAAKRDRLIAQFASRQRKGKPPRITEDDPRWNPRTMGNKRGALPGPKITEDDPRWVQQLGHGQGQERKVGANVTVPRRGRRYA